MSNVYDESSIKKLDPNQHIRNYAHMYIGSVDSLGLHQILYEAFYEGVNEAMAGHCDHIGITLRPDNEVCITNNGPGLLTEPVGRSDVSQLEAYMSISGAGPGPRRDYQVCGGAHGVGIQITTFLSAEMMVEVARDGYLWQQRYFQGKRQTDVIKVRELDAGESTGMSFTFKPDFTIFEPNEFDYEPIAERCRDVAFTLPGLTITLRDERVSPVREQTFHAPGGLEDWVTEVNQEKPVLHDIVSGHGEIKLDHGRKETYTDMVDFALQFTDTMTTTIRGYVNTLETTHGGTHINVLRETLTNIINEYAAAANEAHTPFTPDEIVPGLTAVISLKLIDPIFESQTQIELIATHLDEFIAGVIAASLKTNWNWTEALERIVQKCLANRDALNQ